MMRNLLFLSILVLATDVYSQVASKDAHRKQLGIEAFEKNDLDLSFSLLDSWLRDHPNDGEVYLYRARILNQFKDYSLSDIDYTAYLSFFPNHGEVYMERGRTRYQNGLFAQAKQDFESYISLPRGETSQVIYRKSSSGTGFSQIFTPQSLNHGQAYYHLGLCSIAMKEFSQALIYLDSALVNQPDEPDFYSEKGKALALIGKKSEAKLAYETALALNPDHYLSRQRLIFLTKSTDEKALEELTRSIAALPVHPEPFKQRGYYRLTHKDPSGAKDDFLQALTLAPDDSQLWFYLGTSWASLKNFRESEKAFGKALEIDPRNPEYLLHRGQSRYKINELQSALADFTLMTFYDPDDARGYYHRGITLHRISGSKSACQDLAKAKSLGMPEALSIWEKICKSN